MNKVFTVLIGVAMFINLAQAQQMINYTITADAPEFAEIPNLYITPFPLMTMDFPMWGPNPDGFLNGYVFGYGFRSHANIGEKYQADFNFSQGIWPSKTRHLDIGGAIILRKRTKTKETNIILNTKNPNLQTTVHEYVTVPYTSLKFSGVRGGITHYKSVFDFKEGAFDRVLNAYPSAVGHTNSFGLYGGLTWGKIGNLHIQLKDGRKRSHAVYHQFYADVLLVAHAHNYSVNTINKSVKHIGFRIGADVYKPTIGILGQGTKFINVEVGYRPGYDGLYAKMAFSFIQIRREIARG